MKSTLGAGLALLAWSWVAFPVEPAVLPLDGSWRVALDPQDQGLAGAWFADTLPGSAIMPLPGTTDQAGLGPPLDLATMSHPVAPPRVFWPSAPETERADEAGALVRPRLYLGRAWYQRDFNVPDAWQHRFVTLTLERVLWSSAAWIDGRPLGTSDSLVAPHEYDLGPLAPGPHRLTLAVDNRLIHNLGFAGHAYGAETQSRWNGIVGHLELRARARVFTRGLRVLPAPDASEVQAQAVIENTEDTHQCRTATWRIECLEDGREVGALATSLSLAPGASTIVAVTPISGGGRLWDEFNPVLHRLRLVLSAAGEDPDDEDEAFATFGFRHFERDGRHLRVNGRRLFLRGTLDCCVYPRTGHPPMSAAEWRRVLGTVKAHGFNHVRYHTWCPPEAAFEAADELGLYLAPETPFWVDDWIVERTPTHPQPLGRDPDVTEYVRREIRRISEAYGNHPSFALFCIGNEFGNRGTDWETVEALLAEAKQADPRHLFNGSTARRAVPSDDFWTTHSTGTAGTRGVGPARTDWDFRAAAASTPLPIIAHETGQRPVFPDYDQLLPKFTGPLQPLNYARLERLLRASGLADQRRDFQRASARFQLAQYKAEHEAMLRTPDYAGYQLLMLNDFTGQSEALVGVLDPFWEPKGIVSVADVRQWNQPVVPLARFARYVWSTTDTFTAAIEVAQYGPADLPDAVGSWRLTRRDGTGLAAGTFPERRLPTGSITVIGEIRVPLDGLTEATALRLEVSVAGSANSWPLWAYPPSTGEEDPATVVIRPAYDATAREVLASGGKVLLLAHGLTNRFTARTGFASVYWSGGWWGNRFSSLGILCDPAHPALREFPNDGHSDWQWHDLTQGATTFDLAGAPAGFRPIVQPVPDFHHCHLLAQIFETRVGPGRLLVVGYDLSGAPGPGPAAGHLRRCLLRYMVGPEFNPTTELPAEWLESRLEPEPPEARPGAN